MALAVAGASHLQHCGTDKHAARRATPPALHNVSPQQAEHAVGWKQRSAPKPKLSLEQPLALGAQTCLAWETPC